MRKAARTVRGTRPSPRKAPPNAISVSNGRRSPARSCNSELDEWEEVMEIPSSILSGRLAWTVVTEPPSLEELGMVHLQEAAFGWQHQRNAFEENELALS